LEANAAAQERTNLAADKLAVAVGSGVTHPAGVRCDVGQACRVRAGEIAKSAAVVGAVGHHEIPLPAGAVMAGLLCPLQNSMAWGGAVTSAFHAVWRRRSGMARCQADDAA